MIITDSASAAAASVTQDWADSNTIERQRDTAPPPPPPPPAPYPDLGIQPPGPPTYNGGVVPAYAPTISFTPSNIVAGEQNFAAGLPSPEPMFGLPIGDSGFNPQLPQPGSPYNGLAPYTPQQEVEFGLRKPGDPGWIGDLLTNPIGFGANKITQGIEKIPTGGGTSLGERIDNAPGPLGTIGHLATGAAPFAAAAPFGGEGGVLEQALPMLIEQQIAQGTAETSGQYAAGEISGKQALTSIAVNAAQVLGPHLLRIGIDTVPKAAEWLKSPDGQRAVESIKAKGGELATSERGSLGTPPEPPKEPAGEPVEQPAEQQRVSSVTGEVIPPVNSKLIQALTDVNQSLAERAQQVSAGHARQIGDIQTALGGEGTATERLQAASRARAGALLPEVPGIGDNFSPDEIDQLHGQITGAFDRGEINENQAANAYGIVRDMMNPPEGYKGPQPAERQLIARIFGPEVAQSIPKLGSPAWRISNEIRAIPAAWKLLLTSFSEHGPLNQMFRLGVSNWPQWAKAWAAQLRGFRDVDATQAWTDTSQRPWRTGQGLPSGVLGSEEAGLQLHDPTGGEFNQRAESFQLARDSYIGKAIMSIPGVSQSKNAFLTGINTFRQAMYEKLAQRAMQAGNRDPEFYKSLADYVNKGTGWGTLPEGGARTFAQALFSPRNWVSKFQWPLEVLSKDATIRKQAARDLAGYATAVGGLLTVAKLAGPQVGLDAQVDPRSGRFGQIRLGSHYVNPLRDYSPIIKLAAQLGTRQTIAQTTIGPAAFPTDFRQAIENYLKGPESPIIGLASDLISGTNSAGQQISYTPGGLKTEAFNRLVPIFAREVAEGIRSPDPIHTAFSAPVALFGGSAGSYTTPSEDVFNARQSWAQSAGYKDYADASQQLGPNAAAVAARQSADVTKTEGTHQQQQEDLNTPAGQIRTAITQRMPAEDQNDQKLLSGQETGQQWRDARKLILANQAGAIAQIVNSTGLKDKPTGDPIIDGYFKVFSDYTDPKTGLVADQAALSDALDGYRSKLSPDDQKRLDANTDTGQVTPLVQQYRQVTKQLADAGWFDLASNLYKQGGLEQYAPDIGAFIQKYGKLPPRFNTALGKLRLQTLVQHPELAKGAVQFGFATSGGAKKFAGTQ